MRKVRDHYFKRAKEQGFLARSVYKLQELDRKYRLIRRGDRVLDIGSAPGSWSQYVLSVIGKDGLVVGVDLEPLKMKACTNLIFLQRDIFDLNAEELLKVASGFDVVLSDAAPLTTGVKEADAENSLQLARRAFEVALRVLKARGNFLAKVFQGAGVPSFISDVRPRFRFFKASKPSASRRESKEIYLVGTGRID